MTENMLGFAETLTLTAFSHEDTLHTSIILLLAIRLYYSNNNVRMTEEETRILILHQTLYMMIIHI